MSHRGACCHRPCLKSVCITFTFKQTGLFKTDFFLKLTKIIKVHNSAGKGQKSSRRAAEMTMGWPGLVQHRHHRERRPLGLPGRTSAMSMDPTARVL